MWQTQDAVPPEIALMTVTALIAVIIYILKLLFLTPDYWDDFSEVGNSAEDREEENQKWQ